MRAARTQSNRNRLRGDRRGAAAVEFALTAPLLFLFLFASLEFGRYNMIQQTASNAAFEAARQCILPGASASDGQTAGLGILSKAGICNGTVTVTPYDTSNNALGTISNNTDHVTATVTVPVASNLWVPPVFCGSGPTTKSCTLTCDWVYSAR